MSTTSSNVPGRRGAREEEPSPAKLARLMDFLEEEGIPYLYSREDAYVRVNFVDVFEAMGVEWKGKEWDDISSVLTDLAAEIERRTGWRRDDDVTWQEDTDGWLFQAGQE